MQVSKVKRLKGLEDENGKLKKLLAETMLDMPVSRAFWQWSSANAMRSSERQRPF